jgi:fatty acid desaturase
MRRRKVARLWAMAAVVGAWLWLGSSAVAGMLNGPFLLPGLLLVGMTLLGGITLVVLILHNQADEQDHTDRHQNWFRLIERDLP